jgi:hypothetical protein
MSTFTVSNTINAWVESQLDLTQIYNDVIPDTAKNAICLRYEPAPAAERRYTDGTRLLKWNLTYYVRNTKQADARALAYKITAALDGAHIYDATSGITIETEAATLPQFINVDEKNNTIYSAAIVATYLEPRS